MLKSSIADRIIFPSKKSQMKFFLEIKKARGETWNEIATLWKINIRTLSDWARARHHMPYQLAVKNAEQFGIALPKSVLLRSWKEHATKAGKKGARINLLKNRKIGGDTEYRKEKWRDWWETKGKFQNNKILEAKEILKPNRTKDLAEFIGIMLGDGGIAKYHIAISLNKNESSYVVYITKLIKKMFGVDSKIFRRPNSEGLDIVVQRKKIVDFLELSGLQRGNKIKNGTTVPKWIMQDLRFQKACIRGLIDTDGCFFLHKYRSNGKSYCYQKIDFTSASRPLLKSTQNILINLGFGVRMCRNGTALRIENQRDVLRYMKIIGTHNPRYVNKLKTISIKVNR